METAIWVMSCNIPLTKDDSPSTPDAIADMSNVPYLQAIGSLMFLAVATRPDVAFAVGALSRFNSNPGRPHWKQVQHLFRYLAGTIDMSLCYGASASGTRLCIYSDADVDSSRSTSGYATFIGDCLVN